MTNRKRRSLRLILLAAVLMIIALAGTGAGSSAAASVMTADRAWGSAGGPSDFSLSSRDKTHSYESIGRCTGYVKWAVNTYYYKKAPYQPASQIVRDHVTWLNAHAAFVGQVKTGTAAEVNALYKKLRPGDIVVFNKAKNFAGTWVHIAIVGGDGKTMHHAISDASGGVVYKYTVGGWLGHSAGTIKQSTSCKVYRLLPWTGKGRLMKKAAVDAELVARLKNYDLKGAVYTVKQGKVKKGTLTTNSKGLTNTLTLSPGSYTVTETKAPKNFRLNTKPVTLKVTADKTAQLKVSDTPVFRNFGVLLVKKGRQGGQDIPLKGVRFTVRYYDNDAGSAAGTPKAVWTLASDANGQVKLDQDHLISGTLFRNHTGDAVAPNGTYTVRETRAPEGWKLDPALHVIRWTGAASFQALTVRDTPYQPAIHTQARAASTMVAVRAEIEIGSHPGARRVHRHPAGPAGGEGPGHGPGRLSGASS